MSEQTIIQLALDAGVETGGTENAVAILKFAKSYADQEKRSTAIAFIRWKDEKGVISVNYAPEQWDYQIRKTPASGVFTAFPEYDTYTLEGLYDLFQSLPK